MIRLGDGDHIVIHDDCPKDWRSGDRVALLVHGLAGCHGSGYMVRIAAKLKSRGVRAFRMDMRGSGAASGFARLPGHAGRIEDVRAAIERIHQLCPSAPLTLVGFSMGGNVALGTLAEAADQPIGNLAKAIAVSPPVDLSRCCRDLRQGVRRMYDGYLIRLLVRRWRQTGGRIAGSPPRSIYQFDDEITAPLSGYRDAEHYYEQCSSGPRLSHIQVPTKILAAEDDPVVNFRSIADARRSDSVELFYTRHGGHLGYLTHRQAVPDGRWLDQKIVDWVCE
jgi:predicted alpha/beta-fold hydrolase